MTNDAIRAFCLSLPHTTEVVRWIEHLLFKVGGKMFCIISLDGHRCTFRCTPERYAELVEMPDIVPASHNMWKYHWVTTETPTALTGRQFEALIAESYRIVRATLPKRVLAGLEEPESGRSTRAARSRQPAGAARPTKSARH
jgi:predicted DNA-binding protein (MmcQ/YjbR family)